MPSPDCTPLADFQWLFLDLNSYFASVEQQINPQLRGKPVAVIPLETDATCAIAASYEAKAYGIKTGTKVYEAKRLCPQTIFVLADHQRYVEYHHRIMEELDKHLPIESIESIDEAACRLTGPQCCEEEARAIAQRIKQGIRSHVGDAIRCSIGIAPNKYLAKVATDLQKPDGLVVLRAAELPGRLLDLSLTDLPGIARGMSTRLARHNVHSMAQLWDLSPKHMRHIWGSVGGERFWYALHGHTLPDQATIRRTVGHSHMLSPEWRPHAQACVVAQRLALKAASRLRRLNHYAQAMAVSIRLEHGARYAVDVGFHRACDSATLTRTLREAWQQLLVQAQRERPLQKIRIKKVSITLHKLLPGDAVQPELFDLSGDVQWQKRQESLSRAMDMLNQKYGRDTIVTGFLPRRSHTFSGTKIAFTRIPDAQEFHE